MNDLTRSIQALATHAGCATFRIELDWTHKYLTVTLDYGAKTVHAQILNPERIPLWMGIMLEEALADCGMFEPQTIEAIAATDAPVSQEVAA